VTELQEPVVPVIGAHAAVANACQGQVGACCVLGTVIDGDTAGCSALAQRFYLTLVLAEIVERQWPRLVVDKLNNLVE